jgi:hypothetical protein
MVARVENHRHASRGTHLAEARATANAATNHANHAAPNNHAGLIWAIADLLRGDYKQSEYGRVILPLVLPAASTASSSPPRPRSSPASRH